METQTASVKKIAMNYGLLLGLASIAFSVILYVTGNHLEQTLWSSVISFLIMLAFIVYGLKAFKKDNGGFMSLGEALKTGVAIALISGILGAIYFYVFVTMIEPDFTAQILEVQRETMIEANPDMPKEQMEMSMGIAEKMTQPWIMVAFAVIGSLFFGFIISLVAGLIMKQPKPEHLQ